MKVEENEEIVELALKKLLPEIEVSWACAAYSDLFQNEPDFDVENITNEKALYWRVYCQHLKHKVTADHYSLSNYARKRKSWKKFCQISPIFVTLSP